MTTFIDKPTPKSLVKLTGTIRNLEVERVRANFYLSAEQERRGQSTTGIIAVLGSLVGAGGAAMSTAAHNEGNAEDADYVTFELDNKKIQGWVKYLPFKEGDEVEIAAEPKDEHWVAYAIARPADRMIAIYPNCKRSITNHKWTIFKAWVMLVVLPMILFGSFMILDNIEHREVFVVAPLVAIAVMVFLGIYAISYAMNDMPFAILAEKIFETLGFAQAQNTDLRKSSKKLRREEDILTTTTIGNGTAYGRDYFRY